MDGEIDYTFYDEALWVQNFVGPDSVSLVWGYPN